MAHYEPAQLLQLAASKDAGFSTATFLEALNAINRLSPADWAEDGIDAASIPDLRSIFADWYAQLATADSDC